MRFANLSRLLLLLAAPAVLGIPVAAQDHPNVQPSMVRDRLNQASAATPAPASSAPAAPKNMAKAPAKMADTKAAKTPVEKPAEKVMTGKRDPFDALLNRPAVVGGTPMVLPPGKAGLVVGSLQIDGIVGGAHGMIAIVSNPQQRVYFLREGDKLYDGTVQKITIEAVAFQEVGKDAFGKPMERQVTKRLYPSPGEQQ
jgi:hypothetical protein